MEKITARLISFCNSRAFPLHCRETRYCMASSEKRLGFKDNSEQKRERKCRAMSGMSSGISLSGGVRTETTLSR